MQESFPDGSIVPRILPQVFTAVHGAIGDEWLDNINKRWQAEADLSASHIEAIAQEITQSLINKRANGGSQASSLLPPQEQASSQLLLPLNWNGIGIWAAVSKIVGRFHVWLFDLGSGHFTFGPDNLTIGRWNSLVAYTPLGEILDVFPGHSGEIIPGRLQDHVDRLLQNIVKNEKIPVQLDLDISMACPSNCVFCFSAPYRNVHKRQLIMDRALMLSMIKQWAQLGVKVIRFDGGGDPLTHPNFLEAVELCYELGLQTAVLTAGDLLQENQLETLVRCGTYVRVSLNAGSNESRLLIHKPASSRMNLESILANIAKLAELRTQFYGRDACDKMLIGATSMVHPLNSHEAYTIAARAKKAGFDHISFRVILGEEHRVAFSPKMLEDLKTDFEHIQKELVDDTFLAFLPTRELTDTGYVPERYFAECLACTHSALVEVVPQSEIAANVPCGR